MSQEAVFSKIQSSHRVHLYLRGRPTISSLDAKSAIKVVPIFTTPNDRIRNNNESGGIKEMGHIFAGEKGTVNL